FEKRPWLSDLRGRFRCHGHDHSKPPAVRLVQVGKISGQSGKRADAVMRDLPDAYIKAAKKKIQAEPPEPKIKDGKPVEVFTYFFYVPGHPNGLASYLFHRSTTRLRDVCYLQDLFTAESARGRGVRRHLIEAVYQAARNAGSSRVYWHTQVTNQAGRALYEKVANHSGFI